MTVCIRPFTIENYDAVIALWRQCEGIGLSDADSRQNLASYLARNPGMSFVAEHKKKVVGAVLCGHDARRGYLHHLAVHPDYRLRGIGIKLVGHCMDALRSAGIQKCHLFIFADNADGFAFWQKAGWNRRQDIGVISKVIVPSDAN